MQIAPVEKLQELLLVGDLSVHSASGAISLSYPFIIVSTKLLQNNSIKAAIKQHKTVQKTV